MIDFRPHSKAKYQGAAAMGDAPRCGAKRLIPEHPLLHPSCRVIEIRSNMIVRRGSSILHVTDGELAQILRRLLALLDGRDATRVVLALGYEHALTGLRLLDELAQRSLLADHRSPLGPPRLPLLPKATPMEPGAAVVLLGDGRYAGKATRLAEEAGLRSAEYVTSPAALAPADLWVVLPGGMNRDLLTKVNRVALQQRNPWITSFALDEELVVGPVMTPDASLCWRCIELRWLGIARSIAAEREYFAGFWHEGGNARVIAEETSLWITAAALHRATAWWNNRAKPQSVWIADTSTGHLTVHPVQRHPVCDACQAPPRNQPRDQVAVAWRSALSLDQEPLPIQSLAARLAPIIDDRLGLVTTAETDVDDGGTPLATAYARFAIPWPEQVRGPNKSYSYGVSEDAEIARCVAQIEGIERYCGELGAAPTVIAPYCDVASDAIYPPDLPLYSAWQYQEPAFPFFPFDPGSPIAWSWGYDLLGDRPRLVPTHSPRRGAVGSCLMQESSVGVAAHSSRHLAVLSGLLELVERDAFMIFWLNRLSPPQIDLRSLPPGPSERAIEELRRRGYRFQLADLTTDLGILVVLGLAVREDADAPALAVGAGCGLDRAAAVGKAIRETAGVILSRPSRPQAAPRLLSASEIRSVEDHFTAYAHPAWREKASFLWASPQRKSFDDLPQLCSAEEGAASRLAITVGALADAGLAVLAIDLTATEVLRHGLTVMRSIVPGLQPMGFGHHGTRLGGRRVHDAPRAMGYASPGVEAHLNLDPHCFP